MKTIPKLVSKKEWSNYLGWGGIMFFSFLNPAILPIANIQLPDLSKIAS